MTSTSRVILLELNELTPSLMHRFMEEGRLPHFRRFHDEAQVFTSDAGETGLDLNPWVQWVTVHTGLPLADHGVRMLGEGARVAGQGLADRVCEADGPVWLCGSMNVRWGPGLRGAALPDPWSSDASPQPAELEPFFRFVQHQVAEHTNPDDRPGLGELASFVAFLARRGLSAGSVAAIARQLAAERRADVGWRRVALLDRLQFDVFRWYHARLRPRFASFFSNSVAHLQHTHWREMEPEHFGLAPSEEERECYQHAIRWGYEQNDAMVGRFLALADADPDTTLVFCTALSQQPDSGWDDQGGKGFYRPRDMQAFTAFAGVRAPHRVSPVMSEEFWLEFPDEAGAQEGESALRGLQVAGEPVLSVHRDGREIYAGCSIHHALAADALLETATGEVKPFFELLYAADTLKSGVHHPDGMLWIRTPKRRGAVHEERVPLTAVAPTILGLLGVPIPPSMATPPLL